MSPPKPESTTTPISSGTWQDTPGVRHLALVGPADCGDPYLCDVFTPCIGYIENALNNDDEESPVTCLLCLTCRFEQVVNAMNLGAIEDLDEPELYEHFVDRDALACEFDAW